MEVLPGGIQCPYMARTALPVLSSALVGRGLLFDATQSLFELKLTYRHVV